jgi:hypothetical protein
MYSPRLELAAALTTEPSARRRPRPISTTSAGRGPPATDRFPMGP